MEPWNKQKANKTKTVNNKETAIQFKVIKATCPGIIV